MFPFAIPLAGAALGALANKKDPLKGALLGGGMAYGGSMLFPAIGSAVAGAAPTNAALIDSAVGTQGYGVSSATPGGLLAGAKEAMGYVKPIGEAASTANAIGGLLQDQPVQGHAPQGINPQGSQTLAQIAQQGQVNPEELMKRRYQTNWG